MEGFQIEDLEKSIASLISLNNICICGIMAMGSLTDNKQKTTKEFEEVAQIFQKLRSQYFSNNPKFNQISMGMSGDYKIAVKSGSTMVRIGSLLFGDR